MADLEISEVIMKIGISVPGKRQYSSVRADVGAQVTGKFKSKKDLDKAWKVLEKTLEDKLLDTVNSMVEMTEEDDD